MVEVDLPDNIKILSTEQHKKNEKLLKLKNFITAMLRCYKL